MILTISWMGFWNLRRLTLWWNLSNSITGTLWFTSASQTTMTHQLTFRWQQFTIAVKKLDSMHTETYKRHWYTTSTITAMLGINLSVCVRPSEFCWHFRASFLRLHRMHDMQTTVTDVRTVSVCRSSSRLYRVEVIWCSLSQIILACCC